MLQDGDEIGQDFAADPQVGRGTAKPPVLAAAMVCLPGEGKSSRFARDRLDAGRPSLVTHKAGVQEVGRRVIRGVDKQRAVDKPVGAGDVHCCQCLDTAAGAAGAVELPVDFRRHVPGLDLDPSVVEKRHVQVRLRSLHDVTGRLRDPEFVALAGRAARKRQNLAIAVVVRKQDAGAGRRQGGQGQDGGQRENEGKASSGIGQPAWRGDTGRGLRPCEGHFRSPLRVPTRCGRRVPEMPALQPYRLSGNGSSGTALDELDRCGAGLTHPPGGMKRAKAFSSS